MAHASFRVPARLRFVGSAGERVAHTSLIEASAHGLRLVRPEGGEIKQLLGHEVEGGPLDNAAWVQVINSVGLPVANVLCPIEVKNIRHWVYPNARELHQLLHKAALLQARHPDLEICPVLITRKKSFSTNAMSRELGFRVLDVGKQFVLPVAEVDKAVVGRLQHELGFVDLVAQDSADDGLVRALSTVAATAVSNALNWRTFGTELVEHFEFSGRTSSQLSKRLQCLNYETPFVSWAALLAGRCAKADRGPRIVRGR